ncbi:MAG: winged helix-turn-helix domain-containing protein [Cellulophaga sp.]|nr:winged helix-turn-helix domain-containing protein [Cellulophaga sp.]
MNDYKIKSRIWIEVGDNVLVGEGRIRLLKEIEAKGSLSKAAKAIGMSYKKAWTLIDAVNKSAKEAVVITSIGGEKGGGSILTPYGKNLIVAFESINAKCWSFLDEEFKEIKGI